METAKHLDFIENTLPEHLAALKPDAPAKWGVMNVQEMIEHLADFFDVSSEKIKMKLSVPEEHLPKYKEFLLSDKQFRENTKAPADVLGDQPQPLRCSDQTAALSKLKNSIKNFKDHFGADADKKTLHPVFGNLNFEEWVRLHHKHVTHHLRQFNAEAIS